MLNILCARDARAKRVFFAPQPSFAIAIESEAKIKLVYPLCRCLSSYLSQKIKHANDDCGIISEGICFFEKYIWFFNAYLERC